MKWIEYVRRERIKKGIKQYEMAEKLNISKSYYAALETGSRKLLEPSPFFLEDISYVLGISYIELMKLAGYLDLDGLGIDKSKEELIIENKMLKQKLQDIRNILG